jgi:hypothetical protein
VGETMGRGHGGGGGGGGGRRPLPGGDVAASQQLSVCA